MTRTLQIIRSTLYLVTLLTFPATAQDADLADRVHDATAFVLADDVPDGLWVELTPLADPEGRATRSSRELRPAVLPPEDVEPGLTWLPERVPGAAMVCRGVDPAAPRDENLPPEEQLWAVACDLVALWRADPESLLPPPADPLVVVTAVQGPGVVGRYLVADLPVAGAVISVVPARLEAPVPFALPLVWTGARLARSLVTRDDGFFRLPRLAPGDYVLEARLPGGRLHRSDIFSVPEVSDLRQNAGAVADEELVYDLGDIDVRAGLSLEVRATGTGAGPVPGIDIALRQGATPAELVTFRARTDEDGVARLDGLVVESPSVLTCSAPGLATVRHEWQLLPVIVDCEMEPLAALAGEVFDPDGRPLPDAVVRLLPVEDSDDGDRRRVAALQAPLSAEGAFLFEDCTAGDWLVQAAAPGFRVEEVPVRLEAGDRTLLDPIYLLPGREVLMRIAGPEGEPVPGAEIVAVEPVGSVAATANPDGEARFAHPGPETLIEVSGLEYAAERLRLPAQSTEGAEGPFDVTLRPGGWIRVLVGLGPQATGEAASDESWTPCAGCEVWTYSRDGTARRRLVTDGRGEAVSPALEPGIHRVQRSRFSQAGTAVVEQPRAEERTVRVTEGEVATVRFMSGAGVVSLRLEPVPDPDFGPWSLVVLSGANRKILPPESDGSYRLDLPRPAARGLPLTLRLQRFDPASGAEAWTRVARMPSWPTEDLELALPAGRVKGRTLRTDTSASDAPAAGALVRLIGFHDFAHIAELRTAPDGTFAVPHLAPGVYSVQIRDLIYTYVSLRPGQIVDLGPLRLAPDAPH